MDSKGISARAININLGGWREIKEVIKMKQYFAVDIDKGIVVNEEGDEFTIDQFKKIIERNAEKNVFFDMTLMTQRFVRMDYNLEELRDYYDQA